MKIDINKKTWQVIKQMNADNYDALAIDMGGEKATYRQMFDSWDQNARMFSALGITRANNSKVMVGLLNSIEAVNVIYGLDITGAIPYFFAELVYPSSNVKRYIKEHGITDIVILDFWFMSFFKVARELKEDYGIRNIIVVNSPSTKRSLYYPLNILSRLSVVVNRLSGNHVDYHTMLAKHKDADINYDTANASAISIVLSTSGSSTGTGRQIPFTDVNRNTMARQIHNSGLKGFKRGIRVGLELTLMSPYITITSMNTALVLGGTLVANPSTFLRIVTNHKWVGTMLEGKPNIVLGNTALWKSFQQSPEAANADLSFLRYIVCGGTYSSAQDLQELRDFLHQRGATDIVIVNGYGATEMCGVCMCLDDNFQRFDSMGRLMPNVEALIQDAEGNYHKPADQSLEGELFICSDTVSPDFPDREPSFETRIINDRRFYRTKDIVTYRAEDASYDFVTRVDFMFPGIGAVKIYPLKIENALRYDTRIQNCAIIGKPSGDTTFLVHLYLVLNNEVPHTPAVIQDILNDYVNVRIYNSQYGGKLEDSPDLVTLVDALPLGKGGKTDYKALRDNPPYGKEYMVTKNFITNSVKLTE